MPSSLLRLCTAILIFSTSVAAEEYENAAYGFRLVIPDGWSHEETVDSGSKLELVLAPRDAAHVQLKVSVHLASAVGEPRDVLGMAIDAVAAQEIYTNAAERAGEVAGRDVPGLAVDARSGGADLHLRQLYVAEGGLLYILQSVAPAAEFDETWKGFEDVWSTFAFVPLSLERRNAQRMEGLVARCGSEMQWADTWEEAADRARESKRLVLVYARAYGGFALSDEVMSGPFMAPEIIDLVNERYVPYRMGSERNVPFRDPALYGMSGSTFGAAMLLVTPEGRVVRDGRTAMYSYLVEGLTADPAYPGPPAPKLDDPVAQAAAHLRRGEHDEVLALLADPQTAAGFRLRADLRRRLRHGEQALADLRAARGAKGGEALAATIDVDEASILAHQGRVQDAHDLYAHVLEAHPGHAREPEVLYRLGATRRLLEGRNAAEELWHRLIHEHPDSRWAWKAAATLESTSYAIDRGARLDWPAEELYEGMRVPPFAPLPLAEAARAEQDAIAFLRENQRASGAWISTTELGHMPDDPPDDFQLAITAICIQGLLPHRADQDVARTIETALAWLIPAYEKARTTQMPPWMMDYGVWSRGYVLWCLADAAAAGLRTGDDLAEPVSHLLAELATKQKPGGGWSYYVSTDLANTGNPATQSISFTTAAVLLSLLRAKEVGFDVPEKMLRRGLDSMEAMRNDEGYFEYMLGPGVQAHEPGMALAGAAGRGPVCTLALLRAGRADLDDLRTSLDAFAKHRGSFAKELGKVLMHTGADTQGSHYLLFDYATAAMAVAALPESERVKYRDAVLAEVLRARTAEGCFVDNPTRGLAAGTGQALLAFEALRVPE